MWVAMLTLGPERMVQYADRVHEQRLVGRVPGFWEALVDARPGFALVTALLVTLIAGLAWRLFGPLVGSLSLGTKKITSASASWTCVTSTEDS